MRISINEENLRDYLAQARDTYLNNLKKAAKEKGEEMPKLVEVGEMVSLIIFGSELQTIMFKSAESNEDVQNKSDDSITVKLKMPKEFIDHYNRDKFVESLQRIRSDIMNSQKKNLYYPCFSGINEIKLLETLIDSFNESKIER